MAHGQGVTVVAIPGSLRRDSRTRMALTVALEGAAEAGAHTEMIDLDAFGLPLADGRDDESTYGHGVHRLRQRVAAAQGILLGTPEYHGGYSGVLKNALDLMGFDEFEGKMLGLVGVSGGRLGATNALAALRTIGRTLHAWVVPEQVGVPNAEDAFDAAGRPKDAQLAKRLRGLGRQVARFAVLHSSKQAMEFLQAWEAAHPNPGGAGR